MNRSSRLKTCYFFAVITISSLSAGATEIRLKTPCICRNAFVVLDDIADIFDRHADEAATMAAIRLFPTPTDKRIVRLQELQSLLSLHGIDLARCNFTGAKVVRVVRGTESTAPSPARPGNLSDQLQSEARVEAALREYLQIKTGGVQGLQLGVQMDDRLERLLATKDSVLRVAGGTAPWSGQQQFQLTVQTPLGSTQTAIQAEVSVPELVVVATRRLQRGEVIRAEHVELQPVPDTHRAGDLVYRVEDVVGKQATRSLYPGKPIDEKSVRLPYLVRRGEAVTVFSIASGVRVRSNATVLKDGSQGDLVTLQLPNSRERFTARVTGFKQVEIYAGGTRVR